jgi:hypothetical protein
MSDRARVFLAIMIIVVTLGGWVIYMSVATEDCDAREGTLVRGGFGYECVEPAR